VTVGQRAQVKVPGARTRESALDTFPPANRAAAVSPMRGRGGAHHHSRRRKVSADTSGQIQKGDRGVAVAQGLRRRVRGVAPGPRTTRNTRAHTTRMPGPKQTALAHSHKHRQLRRAGERGSSALGGGMANERQEAGLAATRMRPETTTRVHARNTAAAIRDVWREA
jgi:hypothetical protein